MPEPAEGWRQNFKKLSANQDDRHPESEARSGRFFRSFLIHPPLAPSWPRVTIQHHRRALGYRLPLIRLTGISIFLNNVFSAWTWTWARAPATTTAGRSDRPSKRGAATRPAYRAHIPDSTWRNERKSRGDNTRADGYSVE